MIYTSALTTSSIEQTYVRSTVVSGNIECLDIVVINLDDGLVDPYYVRTYLIFSEERTVKKGNFGFINSDVKSSIGESGLYFVFLLERQIITFSRNRLLVLVSMTVVFAVMYEFGQQKGIGDVMVHQDFGENSSSEWRKQIPL
jgi:hypothetical protein